MRGLRAIGHLGVLLLVALAPLRALAQDPAGSTSSTGDDTLSLLNQDATESQAPSPSAAGDTGVGPQTVAGPTRPVASGPGQGVAGVQPGREAWRTTLPIVYYIFCCRGDNENFFYALARGPSVIDGMAQGDANAALAASGLSGRYQTIRVQVGSLQEYHGVLQWGMVPAKDRGARHVYSVDQLVPGANSILGFTIISHGGQDGPFVPLVQGWGYQDNFEFFRQDKESGQPNSLYNRLVYGARMRFCGCNTGTDYMWYESDDPARKGNPSYAHAAAAILADKHVVTYGKYNSGAVDTTAYCYFACPPGLAYPTRHVKPKENYSFGSVNGQTKFRTIRVRYSSPEERDAYLSWYAKRGVQVQVVGDSPSGTGRSGALVVRAPIAQWYTRRSAKPPILKAIVTALAANPQMTSDDLRGALSAQGHDPSLIEGLLPQFDQIIADGKLARAIEESRATHGGRLDMNDFRLWAVLLRPDKHEWAYRADLCDDPHVAMVRFQE